MTSPTPTPVLDSLVYHTRFHHYVNDEIPRQARESFRAFLKYRGYPTFAPKTWVWKYSPVDKGEYRGDFPMRVSAYYYKAYGISIDAHSLHQMVEKVREGIFDSQEIIYDFDRDLSWERGAFGDPQSCFFGGRSAAMDLLRHHRAAAIRFWTPHDRLRKVYPTAGQAFSYRMDSSNWYDDPDGKKWAGIGRAWIAESHSFPESSLLVFNAYGKTTLSAISYLLMEHLGWAYSDEVQARNLGNTMGTLYMNTGKGFLIGKTRSVLGVHDVDLEWRQDRINCAQCHSSTIRARTISVPTDPFPTSLCRSCFDERWFRCNNCQRVQQSAQGTQVRVQNQLVWMCDACCTPQRGLIGRCWHCNEFHYKTSLRTINLKMVLGTDTHTPLCPKCYPKWARTCNGCSKVVDAQKAKCPLCGTHKNTSKHAIYWAKRNGTFGKKKEGKSSESKSRRPSVEKAVPVS